MMHIESRGDANAVSPTGATGLFQFTRGTGKQYGLFDGGDRRKDPYLNFEAAKRLAVDNINYLTKRGINVTPELVYMAHQQGVGGTLEIARAAQTGGSVSAAVRRNMDLNGGKNQSAGQFIGSWGGKFRNALASANKDGRQYETMQQVTAPMNLPDDGRQYMTSANPGVAQQDIQVAAANPNPLGLDPVVGSDSVWSKPLSATPFGDNTLIGNNAILPDAGRIVMPEDIYPVETLNKKRTGTIYG